MNSRRRQAIEGGTAGTPFRGWLQFKAILRKDLTRELRTREMLISMVLFVLLAMIVFHYAFSVKEGVDLTYFTGGMLWATFIFAMLLGLNRSFAQEKDEHCLDGLLLCPVDRVTIFLAKTAGNLIFLLIIQAVAVPVFTLFFVERSYLADLPLFLLVLLLADMGICALGTLLATISMNTRSRDLLLPILFLPLIVPVLIAATAATTGIFAEGTSLGDLATRLLFLLGFDLVFMVAGVRHLRLRDRRVKVKKLVSAPALFIESGILLVVGVTLAFWYSPIDASTMGFSQKILYYHAPIAETALVAFGVAFVAAVLYLRSQDPKWDRLGVVAVRLGLLFSALVMATGMIWGKAAWDTWWAWEPRLTTFLLVCFLYAAYFVLRSVVEEEQRRATYAAVFAIIAFIDVPITFFATRFLPEGLHPVVITTGGSGMEGSMFVSFFISMIGMTLLLVALIRRDLGIEDLKERVADLKNSIGG